MENDANTEVGRHYAGITPLSDQYDTAYNEHYTTKDMHKAFLLYEHIITMHPGSKEAGYSRTQVQNIVKAVVPEKEIEDSLKALALAHM